MTILRQLTMVLLLAAWAQAEIVDRVVAVVDGHVLTFSAALAEANYQAFRGSREPVTTLEGDSLKAIISTLTDQILLESERAKSPNAAATGEPQRALDDIIRKRFPAPGALERELARYHLTRAQLLQKLSQEDAILQFIDAHLRAQARVLPGDIEAYYRTVLLPQLVRQGQSNPPPLSQVSGDIERILTEQEINRLLDEWLAQLRSRARIKVGE